MPRIKQEFANEDGWSDWIHPLPGYRMVCCDCGLAHILELTTDPDNLDGKLYFRVRLAGRSTAQVRRHMTWKEIFAKIVVGGRRFEDIAEESK